MSAPIGNPQVDEAARWLAAQVEPPHPAVPALKSQFDLSAVEACKAIALAQQYRANPSHDDRERAEP